MGPQPFLCIETDNNNNNCDMTKIGVQCVVCFVFIKGLFYVTKDVCGCDTIQGERRGDHGKRGRRKGDEKNRRIRQVVLRERWRSLGSPKSPYSIDAFLTG